MIMNSNNESSIERVLCRYFVNGVCRDGERCQFSHNRNDRLSSVCRYYQRGNCTYGNRCRYDHVRNDRPDSSRSNNTANYNNRVLPAAAVGSLSPPIHSPQNTKQPGKSREKCASNSTTAHKHVNINNSNNSSSNNINISCSTSSSANFGIERKSDLRVDAPEFIPQAVLQHQQQLICGFNTPPTYSDVVVASSVQNESYTNDEKSTDTTTTDAADQSEDSSTSMTTNPKSLLCPYNMMGQCWYGEACSFTHGDICDLCNYPVLHPTDKEHNSKHRQECLAEHEREMESAFAVAKGREKQCGICMEVVMEKTDTAKQRFGVLPSCKHCFCLDCIRKWRQAKSFENKIIRACPECRTLSDFVVPSTVWVEDDLEKRALIETYHSAMKEKKCKYFTNQANGDDDDINECPFGNKCFYRHVKPDGTVVEGDSPKAIRQRLRQRQRARGRRMAGGSGAGTSSASADLYVLWHFLEERDAVGDGTEPSNTNRGNGHGRGGTVRSRQNHGSIGSSTDWLWDELEYELDLLSITDDDDQDSDSDVGGDFFDLILPP